jgi:hypothetical protein
VNFFGARRAAPGKGPMSDTSITNCNFCGQPVIDIDHYGERLIGCVDCNRWSWEGSKRDRLFMELPEEDIGALRERFRL